MKDASNASKARKPVYRTASPFTQPKISQLQQPNHDAVAQLLTNALRPIGEHRTNLPKATKKRSKKRKRQINSTDDAKPADEAPREEIPPLQPPRIQEDVLVGFNAVTRHLETLSTHSNKMAYAPAMAEGQEEEKKPRHVATVFLLRPLDDLIYSHLPTLCHTASLAYPELPATRLVLLDTSVEKAVAAALKCSPTVSVLALLEPGEDGVGSEGLINYVRKEVAAVEVAWLKKATEAQWLGIKVDGQ